MLRDGKEIDPKKNKTNTKCLFLFLGLPPALMISH